jgi:hypothetical protein
MTETTPEVNPSSKFEMVPLPQSSDKAREANGRKKAVGDNDERCVVGNSPINDKSPAVGWVHLSTAGNLFPASVTVEEVEAVPNATEGTMYFHPVGSSCAKRIPKGYLSKD